MLRSRWRGCKQRHGWAYTDTNGETGDKDKEPASWSTVPALDATDGVLLPTSQAVEKNAPLLSNSPLGIKELLARFCAVTTH